MRVGRPRRHHLVERLIAGDHPEVAAGALLERVHARLEITDLRGELLVALGELLVVRALGRDRALEPLDLTNPVLGKPRSEERRVGKECRARGLREPERKRAHATHDLTNIVIAYPNIVAPRS